MCTLTTLPPNSSPNSRKPAEIAPPPLLAPDELSCPASGERRRVFDAYLGPHVPEMDSFLCEIRRVRRSSRVGVPRSGGPVSSPSPQRYARSRAANNTRKLCDGTVCEGVYDETSCAPRLPIRLDKWRLPPFYPRVVATKNARFASDYRREILACSHRGGRGRECANEARGSRAWWRATYPFV